MVTRTGYPDSIWDGVVIFVVTSVGAELSREGEASVASATSARELQDVSSLVAGTVPVTPYRDSETPMPKEPEMREQR